MAFIFIIQLDTANHSQFHPNSNSSLLKPIFLHFI